MDAWKWKRDLLERRNEETVAEDEWQWTAKEEECGNVTAKPTGVRTMRGHGSERCDGAARLDGCGWKVTTSGTGIVRPKSMTNDSKRSGDDAVSSRPSGHTSGHNAMTPQIESRPWSLRSKRSTPFENIAGSLT